MTEKHYGGESGFGFKPRSSIKQESSPQNSLKKKDKKTDLEIEEKISLKDVESLKKAGKIISEIGNSAKIWIKKGMSLLEIAEKIESEIEKAGAKPAFPVNLSIDEIAAHSTPSFNDSEKAHGLLKVDLGCHIDGLIADSAFSIDLDNDLKNRDLIDAAYSALNKALEIVTEKSTINKIGAIIDEEIKKKGFLAVRNLSGHSIEPYDVHAGLSIPNFDNNQEIELGEGVYAIEPFSTNGSGVVREGKPSGIYQLREPMMPRDELSRKLIDFIFTEYQNLPFASRWIYKKFGIRGLLSLKQMETQGILYQYPQLIEKSGGKVAQAEHTLILLDGKKIITTL